MWGKMLHKMKERGIHEEVIHNLSYCGIDFNHWLGGFENVETSVRESVELLHNHPLIPESIIIYGFVMDSSTGELKEVIKR